MMRVRLDSFLTSPVRTEEFESDPTTPQSVTGLILVVLLLCYAAQFQVKAVLCLVNVDHPALIQFHYDRRSLFDIGE